MAASAGAQALVPLTEIAFPSRPSFLFCHFRALPNSEVRGNKYGSACAARDCLPQITLLGIYPEK
jgi:hypothetical protein